MQVVLATEHGTIFGHGVGNRGSRLAEMTVKGGTIVGGTPLGTVDKGEGSFESVSYQFCP